MIKFISFCFGEIRAQLKGNKTVFAVIILTSAVTLAAVLMLINVTKTSLGEVEAIEYTKCIYPIWLNTDAISWDEMQNELKTVSDGIFDTAQLPEIEEADLSVSIYYNDDYKVEVLDNYFVTFSFNIIPSGDTAIEQEIRLLAEESITSGEMPYVDDGRDYPAILLGENIAEYFEDAAVGSVIEIGNMEYEVVGMTSNYSYILGNELDGDCETQLQIQQIIFSEKLTAEQEEYFESFLSRYDVLELRSQYEAGLSGDIMTYVTYGFVAVLLILFCMVTIMRLFSYVFTDRLYVYNIYKIHGIRQGQLAATLAVIILLVIAISSVLGVGLFVLSRPMQKYFYIYREMSAGMIAAVIVVMLLTTIVTAFPTIRKLATRLPLDRTFWR